MTHKEALQLERAGDIPGAVALYEQSLAVAPLEVMIDLAVLYWQITDYGFWSTLGLPVALVDLGATRSAEVLDEAQRRFPNVPAPIFWRKYIAWADVGEPLSLDDCRRWLAQDPTSLEPALYLFMISQGKECRPEAMALLHEARAHGSTRSKYIASVIESVSGD